MNPSNLESLHSALSPSEASPIYKSVLYGRTIPHHMPPSQLASFNSESFPSRMNREILEWIGNSQR